MNVLNKFVEILLLNRHNMIKIEQTLKPTGKQVAIINDVHLCLYSARFIILVTIWPRRHAASHNVQTKYARIFIVSARRVYQHPMQRRQTMRAS